MTLSIDPLTIDDTLNNITCSIAALEISTEPTKTKTKIKTKTTATTANKVKKKTNTKLIAREVSEPVPPPNVILHLKCLLKDLEHYNYERNKIVKDPLQYNPEIPPEIKAYEEPDVFSSALTGSAFCSTENDNNEKNKETFSSSGLGLSGLAYPYTICHKCKEQTDLPFGSNKNPVLKDWDGEVKKEREMVEVNSQKTQWKLKELKIQFYNNEIEPTKKSACLWCSYDFDNEPFYLPKQETSTNFIVYGCFCTPECATGYLFKERIDDTAKFERFHLLNKMYHPSCTDNENIHPAPNPYLLLDRYLGNLTIQEYRDLLKKGRTFDVVEKPLSRILPELHADMNSGGGQTYKVKRSNGSTTT